MNQRPRFKGVMLLPAAAMPGVAFMLSKEGCWRRITRTTTWVTVSAAMTTVELTAEVIKLRVTLR